MLSPRGGRAGGGAGGEGPRDRPSSAAIGGRSGCHGDEEAFLERARTTERGQPGNQQPTPRPPLSPPQRPPSISCEQWTRSCARNFMIFLHILTDTSEAGINVSILQMRKLVLDYLKQ
ncbi:uncharacterized protein LOC144291519 [Canis aureus]